MHSILLLIDTIIDVFIWLLIFHVILSWLITFNVVNTRNRFVYMIGDFLFRITEPALKPIRRVMPNFGGIDISPVALILALWFARNLMFEYLA